LTAAAATAYLAFMNIDLLSGVSELAPGVLLEERGACLHSLVQEGPCPCSALQRVTRCAVVQPSPSSASSHPSRQPCGIDRVIHCVHRVQLIHFTNAGLHTLNASQASSRSIGLGDCGNLIVMVPFSQLTAASHSYVGNSAHLEESMTQNTKQAVPPSQRSSVTLTMSALSAG
jgi:hypothetical protein